MDIIALEKSFILLGIGMAVLFVFMGLLIAFVHYTVKFLNKFSKKNA